MVLCTIQQAHAVILWFRKNFSILPAKWKYYNVSLRVNRYNVEMNGEENSAFHIF